MVFMRRAARHHPDVLLHHHIGWATDQDEVLDVVSAYKNQPTLTIDRSRVHHCQSRLAILATRYERPESQAAHNPNGYEYDEESDQCENRPHERCRVIRTRDTFQPSLHTTLP